MPLLEEAFTWFTQQMSVQYREFFAGVTGPEMACESITTLIYSSQVTTPPQYGADVPALCVYEPQPLVKNRDAGLDENQPDGRWSSGLIRSPPADWMRLSKG
ncbi:Uncharacterised protein [Leclercia adecarboxylata]|uniref:Uncharacterized protein n=1 Tax=Leclercia adecarboxylata TaxID=83655 RepID=A0A4U9HNS0_9ENTR|nr:Uncharacterised protein [Leclercia adecarboxylata]